MATFTATDLKLYDERLTRLRVSIENDVLALKEMIVMRAQDKRSVSTKYAIFAKLRMLQGAMISYGIMTGVFDDILIPRASKAAAALGYQWDELVKNANDS